MKTYRVKALGFRKDGEDIAPGGLVELEEKQAAPLLAIDAIAEAAKPAAKKEAAPK